MDLELQLPKLQPEQLKRDIRPVTKVVKPCSKSNTRNPERQILAQSSNTEAKTSNARSQNLQRSEIEA